MMAPAQGRRSNCRLSGIPTLTVSPKQRIFADADIDDFSLAVAGVYDASMNTERWPDALAHFAKMFGGTVSQISVASSPREIAFVKIWGIPDDVLARMIPGTSH